MRADSGKRAGTRSGRCHRHDVRNCRVCPLDGQAAGTGSPPSPPIAHRVARHWVASPSG